MTRSLQGLLVILLLYTAAVAAAGVDPSTCDSLTPPATCKKVSQKEVDTGEFCGFCTNDKNEATYYYCSPGTVCLLNSGETHPVCTSFTVSAIGESCAAENSFCEDGVYDVACLDNDICGGREVFAPGESCPLKTFLDPEESCYFDQCVDGVCSFAPTGGACNGALRCLPSDYCDLSAANATCKPRVPVDAACGPATQCDINAACVAGVCVRLGSVNSGGACGTNSLLCASGLYCANAQCTADDNGETCDYALNDCSDSGSCICNWATGNAQCSGISPQATEAALYYSCLVANSCAAYTGLFPGNCANTCKQQYQSYLSALSTRTATNGLKGGLPSGFQTTTTSSSSRLASSIAVVAVTVAAVIMLVE